MSVDVGTVASALVSSDTSYEPRISFFMWGMNLVLSNPRGEAGRSNLALTRNHDGLWTIVTALGEYQRNTFSRIASATTSPITSTSFKGRTSICDGESGCGCKMILPSSTAHQQHANPVRISKK